MFQLISLKSLQVGSIYLIYINDDDGDDDDGDNHDDDDDDGGGDNHDDNARTNHTIQEYSFVHL